MVPTNTSMLTYRWLIPVRFSIGWRSVRSMMYRRSASNSWNGIYSDFWRSNHSTICPLHRCLLSLVYWKVKHSQIFNAIKNWWAYNRAVVEVRQLMRILHQYSVQPSSVWSLLFAIEIDWIAKRNTVVYHLNDNKLNFEFQRAIQVQLTKNRQCTVHFITT